MRYIDAFCHFSPKRYFDALVESPAGQKDIGKRVRAQAPDPSFDQIAAALLTDPTVVRSIVKSITGDAP